MGTYAHLYHHRCRLLNRALMTSRMVPFLFSPDSTTSMTSKKNFFFVFRFVSDHLKWHSAQWRQWCFWIMFIYGFIFAWQSFNLHLWVAPWVVFTDNDFWKCSWAHAVISMSESSLLLTQSYLRAWRSQTSILIFGLVPQRCLQICWFFWSFYKKFIEHSNRML